MTHDKYLERFKTVLDEMYETTRKKNSDYASPQDAFRNFREFGAVGILVRMSDKYARLKTALWEKREFQVNESIKDTAIDLAVYSILLLLMLEESSVPAYREIDPA